MAYGVILAGGKGERFWPRSRRDRPKQLLPLVGDQPMLLETVERIEGLVPKERILVVATVDLRQEVMAAAPDLDEANLFFEPMGRNTAVAIGYAAMVLSRRDPDSEMIVLPADHFIADRERFLQTVEVALKTCRMGNLVTFGVVPTRPETGYGYIHVGQQMDVEGPAPVHAVLAFKEKPNQKQAQHFLKQRDYLWNSGMFVWQTRTIIDAIHSYMPDLGKNLDLLGEALGTKREEEVLHRLYSAAESISIDYGVMERATNVAVVRADFVWDDVGSWTALERFKESDEQGNVLMGDAIVLDGRDNIISSENGLVAAIGVSGLIIVRVQDITLVCQKGRHGDVRDLVRSLYEKEDMHKYL
jgi:mannose-1-phosphate guanylyltransferase